MSELLDTARWLSRQLTANHTAISALSAPQLATSSIEAGTVQEFDTDGALVSAVGAQFDGTHAAVTLGGPVPPEPVPPTVTPGINTAEVRWNGKFVDDEFSPMDFSHVTVHASQLESFTPDNTTQQATITGESGDIATLTLDAGEWYFLLVAVSKAGKWSYPSDTVLAEVTDAPQDTTTNDWLNVVNSAGTTVATISAAGDMTANSINVATDIIIKGTALSDSLKTAGQGLMAWASRFTDGTYWAGLTQQPYLSLQVDGIVPGRAYMVQTSPINTKSDTANSDVIVQLHLGPGGRAANASDPVIAQGYSVPTSNTSVRNPITINRLLTPTVSDPISLCLSYGVESTGRGKIMADAARNVVLTVTDIGLGMTQTGEERNGSADVAAGGTGGGEVTPPAIKKNYDQTWTATGFASFNGDGTSSTGDPSMMACGLGPNGDMSSMAVFPDLTGTLAGATVTGVWAYLYFDYWDNPAGSTANIALHGQPALTSSKPALSYATYAVSANWAQASGRWVKISSSTYAGWAAGTHKGFTLGGSGSTEPYGLAHNPQLRITWTK
jgi:hypothetical protein